MGIRQSWDQMVTDYKAAMADGSLSLKDYLELIADGAGLLESTLRGIVSEDEFNQLVTEVENFVQQVIVPIDLTKYRVPAMVERLFIDPQLLLSVRPTLEALREVIARQEANKKTLTSE